MFESAYNSKEDDLREFEESAVRSISMDSTIENKKITFTPVIPSLSKSSPQQQASLAKYIKSARFMPPSIHRPKLLSDINLKIEGDLRKLTQNSEPNSISIELERLGVFQSAFQTYIDDTSLYKTVLERIKEEYDNAIESFKGKLESFSYFEKQRKETDVSHERIMEEIKQRSENEIKDLVQKVKAMEELVVKLRREKVNAEMGSSKYATESKHFQIEYNNLRSTSIAIAASLTRSEDNLFKAQQMLVDKEREVNEGRASAMRMSEEINNLQLSIHTLKSAQASTVSVEHTNQLESTVQVLKDEGIRLDHIHRQLLVRYAMLKSAVDTAFDKWNSSTLLRQAHSNNVLLIEQKVSALVSPLTKKVDSIFEDKTDLKKDVAERLIRMMEDGANPRIVLDSLLDHLEVNKALDIASMGIRVEEGSMSLEGAYAGSPMFSRLGTARNDNNDDELNNYESTDQFEGMGMCNEVPMYLRHEGKVQNISLSHRDAVKLLNDIWEAKEVFDKEERSSAAMTPFTLVPTSPQPIPPPNATASGAAVKGASDGRDGATAGLSVKIEEAPAQLDKLSPRKLNSRLKSNRKVKNSPAKKPGTATAKLERPTNPDMATFLNYYLGTKYSRDLATKIAYALHDALKKYARLSDFKLFQMVLDGQVNPEVWRDQSALIDELYNAFINDDSCGKYGDGKIGIKGWAFKNVIFDKGGDDLAKREWRLSPDEILRLTKRVFKTKSVNHFLELAKSLQIDARGCKLVDPLWLLSEDQYGSRSNFLESLKILHMSDCLAQEQRTLQSIDKFAASAAASAAATAAAAAAAVASATPNGIIAAHPPHMKSNVNSKPNNGRIHVNSAERGKRKGMENKGAQENQVGNSTAAAAAVVADIEMPVGKFRDALMEALPDWSRQEISQLLCRGCDCSLEDALLMEAKRATVSVEAFKKRLRSKLIAQANLSAP